MSSKFCGVSMTLVVSVDRVGKSKSLRVVLLLSYWRWHGSCLFTHGSGLRNEIKREDERQCYKMRDYNQIGECTQT